MLPQSFYTQPVPDLAIALLGCELVHLEPAGATSGIIVETEAYRHDDPASHSFNGKTLRNAAMFGPAGRAYVYRSYGIHFCLNVVGEGDGSGAAVLIRALEPTQGLAVMRRRRQTRGDHDLCNGPGKLTQALGITPEHNAMSLNGPVLYIQPARHRPAVATSPRIGISRATDTPWRFMVRDNPYVTSHKFNKSALAWQYEQETAVDQT